MVRSPVTEGAAKVRTDTLRGGTGLPHQLLGKNRTHAMRPRSDVFLDIQPHYSNLVSGDAFALPFIGLGTADTYLKRLPPGGPRVAHA